jgi:hypothetical protein
VRRFAASRYHHAGARRTAAGLHLDCGCEVHQQCDGTQDALRVEDELQQLAQRGAAAPIQDAVQGGMIMIEFAHLHEKQPVAELVDDGLPSAKMPSLDGETILASRHDDPVRHLEAKRSRHWGWAGPFGVG